MGMILYGFLIMEFFSFLYYVYEYVNVILPKNKISFTKEEKEDMVLRIKSLKKDDIIYALNGCIYYNKKTHMHYDKNNFDILKLTNIEIRKLITHSLLNNNDIDKYDKMVDDIIEHIEKECGIQFKNIDNDRFIYSKFGQNFIYFHYRPLFLNIFSKTIINTFHYYMIFSEKYEFYKCKKSNISYLYKNNNKKENILFMHGFGVGYIPYLRILKYLNEKYNIIIFIMPNVSGYYWGCVPEKYIIVNSVNEFMTRMDIKRYNMLGHSFGTYVGQILLNNDKMNRINKIIFIDPIIFWVSCFKIGDFVKYENYVRNLTSKYYLFALFIFYMVNMDIYVNHVCFRRLKPFEFMITTPCENTLYVISNNDNLIDADILNRNYKNYKNVIFLDNTAHGDILLSLTYDKFLKEIINFYNQ